MLRRAFVLALVVGLCAQVAEARKPKERYYLELGETEKAAEVPEELVTKAVATLDELLRDHDAFVTELAGAPDPEKNPKAFKKYLARKKLRAFQVLVKFTKYEDTVGPPKPGKSGQILTVHVALQLLGTGIPDETMALSGEGSSTVALEIGNTVRERDRTFAREEALTGALRTALDDAVHKLRTTPRARPRKR